MTSIPRRPSARITILPFVISVVLVYLNCCSAPFGALNNPYDAKNPSYVAVTGVSLNATTLSLSVGGGSSTLTATIAPVQCHRHGCYLVKQRSLGGHGEL